MKSKTLTIGVTRSGRARLWTENKKLLAAAGFSAEKPYFLAVIGGDLQVHIIPTRDKLAGASGRAVPASGGRPRIDLNGEFVATHIGGKGTKYTLEATGHTLIARRVDEGEETLAA